MVYRLIACLTLVMMTACASVSPESAALNAKVSVGIQRYHTNITMPLIAAWEKSQRERFNDELPKLYDTARAKFIAKKAKAAGQSASTYRPTAEDELTITKIMLAFSRANDDKISAAVADMTKQSEDAANTLIALNDDVTRHLQSNIAVEQQQERFRNQIAGIVGVKPGEIEDITKTFTDFMSRIDPQ